MLTVRNDSSTKTIKNIFLICSHPVLFGLKCMPLTPGKSLAPDEEISMPIDFRASLVGQVNVRFVIRYEVEGLAEDAPAGCRFRLARMILFLNSNLAFKVAPFVNMSVKDSDRYIVNFQTWQKMIASWYERPKFNSIEIVRGTEVWHLTKKDE